MQCEQVLRDEITERYLLGALSTSDQEAFEQHYFECASCFDRLENLSLLRQALAGGAAAGNVGSLARRRRTPWTWAAAAVLALVAGGLYWQLVRSNGPPGGPGDGDGRLAEQQPAVPVQPAPQAPSPSAHPPSSAAEAAARSAALAALAVVQPPQYAPTTLRGALDAAARGFREAMRLYVSKDYAGARAGLRAAAGLDRERPDIAFFLGVSELLTGEPGAAITELERTIALGESPYREEAHFYLAKAHVRRGDLAAAAAHFEATVRLRGEREEETRELLQKLEALRRSSPGDVPPS